MRHVHPLTAGALGLTTALALAACGSSGSTSVSTNGKSKSLTVWVMTGDYTPETIAAVNKEFTAQTGAKVNVQIQQWEGITTKVSTALATSNPPDVLDLGNTQVAGYAANGGLLDLTKNASELAQGRTWLAGLRDPATVDGKLYGVPGFAGDRAVIYNKKIWEAAGVTTTPKTYAELTAALDKVKAKNTAKDFSAFYFPGQYWYGGMQFVWDAGGEIAVKDGGTWKGAMSSSAVQKGLNDFKTFVNAYSTPASRTLNTDSPNQDQIFADGKTSAVLVTAGHLGLVQKANSKMTEADIGTFPFPGLSGKPQPVMLGGSDWGIAAKSQNAGLALAWVKIAASPKIQDQYVFGNDGWIPNSEEGIKAAQSAGLPALQQGYFTAALNSKATPAAASWSTLEGDQGMERLFSSVASGAASPAEAAKTFDTHLQSTLADDK